MKLSIAIDRLTRLGELYGDIEFKLLDNEFHTLVDDPVIQYCVEDDCVSVSIFGDEDLVGD